MSAVPSRDPKMRPFQPGDWVWWQRPAPCAPRVVKVVRADETYVFFLIREPDAVWSFDTIAVWKHELSYDRPEEGP